ncbi:heat-shock protein Hsp20 [Pelomyxa schiedti]|nr:heat-shock protein Hsp20 [Pelomyxa schiedti]
MERQMNRMFGSDWNDVGQQQPRLTSPGEPQGPQVATTTQSSSAPPMDVVSWHPRCDLRETDTEYQIHTELPGVRKEDVSVDFAPDGTLVIRGKKEHEREETNERWHTVERSFGTFQRSFNVPQGTDPSKITAQFDNGVLKLGIPKTENRPAVHRIDIK